MFTLQQKLHRLVIQGVRLLALLVKAGRNIFKISTAMEGLPCDLPMASSRKSYSEWLG